MGELGKGDLRCSRPGSMWAGSLYFLKIFKHLFFGFARSSLRYAGSVLQHVNS